MTPEMLEPQAVVDQQRAPSSGYQVPTQQLPTSGFRLPLQGSSHSDLPPLYLAGQPIVNWPEYFIYFGSAICDKSVHPCKIEYNMRHLPSPCTVVLDNTVISHKGRYDLLQFNPDTMELVCVSEGRIPAGRRPIKGGYEEDGMPLYHGVGTHHNGHKIPGETSPRLGGCVYANDDNVHLATDHEILCAQTLLCVALNIIQLYRQVLEVMAEVYKMREDRK
ncbi:uncharacterized protein ARMOST_17807 [Armillaria ostoyae]|uniref:Uncharacterized protein n=1 Tax=Armillaria ostoyae TaxID=47428 RepID=A0A284S024_ARMOS|nr:uncharacterized protein ARMOST_17807 [Armillaria ostoyae]